MNADLVLVNGNVLTLAGDPAPSEAIAVRNGLVAKVGTSSEIRSCIGPRTEVVDLRGRTVIPGVNDAHIHPLQLGINQPPLTLDLSRSAVRSIADMREALGAAAQTKRPGEWIRGAGWDQGYLSDGRYPHRRDIDDLTPDNPVAFREWSGHALWVNTKALELAGIDRHTEPPLGGVIVKDGAGEPTGLLLEGAARLVDAVVPEFTEDEQRRALTTAIALMHRNGITSITDAGTDSENIARYAALQASGAIRQRVTAMLLAGGARDLRGQLEPFRVGDADPRWLNVSQVKIYGDGVPTQARTAWVSEPYVGGGTGAMTTPGDTPEEQLATLQEWVMTAHELGFQVGTHATGDRTVNAVVDAYQAASAKFGGNGLRHYVIHGDLTREDDLRRIAASGFGVSFNPQIKRSLSHQLVDVLGRERTDYQWPFRTAMELGVPVGSASDAPVVGLPDFREGLAAMVTRASLATGEVFGADQVIGLGPALASYTSAGAWQDGAERWKGTLAEGMAADLAVLGDDLMRMSAHAIADVPVELTCVGGEVVYEAESPDRTDSADPAAAAAAGEHSYLESGCCHD